jgi:hemoglobin
MSDEISLYERVGGTRFFEHLVGTFYEGVATDAVLAPLYPEYGSSPGHDQGFTGARRRLTLFLVQYWGGPTTYSDERGHPRLRMRHMPFTIGEPERDRWLVHMMHAVDVATDALDIDAAEREDIAERLRGYFVPGAEHMRNNTGLPITSTTFRQS